MDIILEIYVEKAKYLCSLDDKGLLEEHLAGVTAYRFTDFSLENNNYSRTMVQDVLNSIICNNI